MNCGKNLAKKAIALLISLIMLLTLSCDLKFLAFATEQQEVDFCVDKMKNLPIDSDFLNEMTKLPEFDELKESRTKKIVHSDGSTEDVPLNEKECYQKIKEVVDSLVENIGTKQIMTETKEILDLGARANDGIKTEPEKTQSTNNLPEKMQKADAIYRWVAKNIRYDFESCNDTCEKTKAKRKPQDAYFVFNQKTGVCEGYARLTNLMMRMAGVPCMYVGSINGPDKNYGHAFNAIYVEDESDDRKGWTLLDSCWASPNGSDGDGEIKKYLSGESYFSKYDIYDEHNDYSLKNLLLREDSYINEIFDALEINSGENPSQEFIDGLNKKMPNTLKKANEKYKDGPHFEAIEFFNQYNSLYFKYKTDLNMQQAKQAKDRFEELQANYYLIVDILKGKLEVGVINQISNEKLADLTKEDLSNEICPYTLSTSLREVNGNLDKFYDYNEKLQEIFVDTIFPKLNDIEKNIGEINDELNNQLKGLNEKYSDITTIKKVELSLEKESGGFSIAGKFEADLSEEEIQKRVKDYEEKENELHLSEYFPAFYKTDQSFEEANRSIVSHTFHKIERFEVDSLEAKKINFPSLGGSEGKSKLILIGYVSYGGSFKKLESLTISDDNIKLNDQTSIKYNSFGIEIGIIDFKNLTVKGGVAVDIGGGVDNLTIEGDATINLDNAYGLTNIDTTKSKKYHAENGILYHTINDEIGTKGERIGEIFKLSTDLG